jgi:hypothetical protein
MRPSFLALLLLASSACAPIMAEAGKPYPNIVVPRGPAGQLAGVELEGVGDPLCAKKGVTTYCMRGFGSAIKGGVERMFGEYFRGAGPSYTARFTVNEVTVGEKHRDCGRVACSSMLPVLEWRFELVREGGDKPVRIALTTYGHRGFQQNDLGAKGADEAAEALIEQVLSAINARLSPAS